MLTLYLRKVWLDPARFYVEAYADREGTQRKAHWAWHNAQRPDYRNKYVMLNCWRWRVEWLPARVEA